MFTYFSKQQLGLFTDKPEPGLLLRISDLTNTTDLMRRISWQVKFSSAERIKINSLKQHSRSTICWPNHNLKISNPGNLDEIIWDHFFWSSFAQVFDTGMVYSNKCPRGIAILRS